MPARPLVLAHRGASGRRPENTLAAIGLAIELGADGVEIDVVPTRDGVLVVRHDAALAATTDIGSRPRFADRRRDGDWWTTDLDAREIAKLKARERWPELRRSSAAHDGEHGVPTLAKALDRTARANVLLVVEIKDARAFAAMRLDPVPLLEAALTRAPARPPIVLESFEKTPLLQLAGLGLPLVYLLDAEGAAPDEEAAGGPDYAAELADPERLVRLGLAGVSLPVSLIEPELVARLHAAGLSVWAWTLRAEPELQGGDPPTIWEGVLSAGVDAVFADQPDRVLAAMGAGAPAPRAR